MQNLNDDVLSLIFKNTNPQSINNLKPFFKNLIEKDENYYYQRFLKIDYHILEPKTQICKSLYQSLENLNLSGEWTIKNQMQYDDLSYIQEYDTKIIYDQKHHKFNATGEFQDLFLPTNHVNFKIAGYFEKYNLKISGVIYFSIKHEDTHQMSYGKSYFNGHLNFQKFKENILEINSEYEFRSDLSDFICKGKTFISKKDNEPK